MSSYQDFLRGHFHNLSLSRDGTITLAPVLDSVFASGQAVIWSVAQGPGGSIYAGTGNRGRLYRIDPQHHSTLVWTADEPEIFAVTVSPDGTIYAGTSPDGKIYRIQDGKAQVYFEPHQKYVWALATGKDGALYAGTGDEGKVFRITAANTGDVYYATGQSHVTGISFDRGGQLLAGSFFTTRIFRRFERSPALPMVPSTRWDWADP
jgi:WD40 repeat protein